MNRLLVTYETQTELEENFSIIETLVKFNERYLELSPQNLLFLEKAYSLENWKFVMKSYLSEIAKEFDYYRFFVLFRRIKSKKFFPFEKDNTKYYLLFFIYIHHIHRRKDFELFESNDPDLPLLVWFIFNIKTFSSYDSFTFYQGFHEYLGFGDKFLMLKEVLDSQKEAVISAKKKLGLGNCSPMSISHLLKASKHLLYGDLEQEFHNTLWELKGLAIIERAFKNANLIELINLH